MLKQLASFRTPWLLLASSALILEMVALFFQYGMRLEPCVMCVYQRVAVLGLFVAGVVGAFAPEKPLVRWAGIGGWLVSAIWGLKIAYEHVDLQLDPSPFKQCAFIPDFPAWFKVDQWLPAVFEARGDCTQTVWQFLGLSMPQWMMVIFSLYLLVALAVIIGQLLPKKA
ncbi:disulfide bond formation protein DsbB [Gallaecimonas xiamenensis]|uniref:Disulfide bond formation protein B n=1 Tax=Gallaecimonas xiamenensis 3-C-1 TaxID=745411 RepID=K2J2R1_9GAMM|nr:disulfide bond formation protein DsbB [Gallaecimonas xiamenensis]EKE69127.1 disulfide bond formation protein B [Gallaecimonas xiamenensis 3-C-1]